ncbi:MAG: rhodanese-like domain-containing protein [Acidobacteria bacterium]|nr:rhodanese-like domain-containing protein [Acidobacteriota bacterium]MBV9477947.1 rhodanese-like domain-containing protein [Acidobacteriota bacterium]
MAKRPTNEPEPQSSRTSLIILSAGAIVVMAIVGWALTRSVTPSVPDAPTLTGTTVDSSTSVATTAPSSTATSPTGTLPPLTTAANTPTADERVMDTEEDKRNVPRIAVEDLIGKVKRGEVTVIDVRDEASFFRGHIPGALHIPLASVESQLAAIPRGKPIVTYCT